MFGFLLVMIVIACILLVVIVLAQNPKGGGLAQGFSGGGNIMGVQGTNKFLTNTTWGLVGFIALASIFSTAFYADSNEKSNEESVVLQEAKELSEQQAATTSLPINQNAPQQQAAE